MAVSNLKRYKTLVSKYSRIVNDSMTVMFSKSGYREIGSYKFLVGPDVYATGLIKFSSSNSSYLKVLDCGDYIVFGIDLTLPKIVTFDWSADNDIYDTLYSKRFSGKIDKDFENLIKPYSFDELYKDHKALIPKTELYKVVEENRNKVMYDSIIDVTIADNSFKFITDRHVFPVMLLNISKNTVYVWESSRCSFSVAGMGKYYIGSIEMNKELESLLFSRNYRTVNHRVLQGAVSLNIKQPDVRLK